MHVYGSGLGFRPAYLDFATCAIYLSVDRYGRPTPFHTPEALPEELVTRGAITGRVTGMKSTLIAGFERNGFFYTRTAAAHASAEWAG